MTILNRIALANYERAALCLTEDEYDELITTTLCNVPRFGIVVDPALAAEQSKRAVIGGS